MLKNKLSILFFSVLFLFSFSLSVCLANESEITELGYVDDILQMDSFQDGSGLDNFSLGGVVAIVIQTILSIMGVIFLSLMIYGGYTWMMARGNEEEAKKAQGIIRMAVIGLIIIVTAYAITYFVFNALSGDGVGNIITPVGGT